MQAPEDADARRGVPPVICYPVDALPRPDLPGYRQRRAGMAKVSETLVQPRDAGCFDVPA